MQTNKIKNVQEYERKAVSCCLQKHEMKGASHCHNSPIKFLCTSILCVHSRFTNVDKCVSEAFQVVYILPLNHNYSTEISELNSVLNTNAI